MAEVYFIDINSVKELSLIDENVDNKLLLPTLTMVQDIYLQKILGTPLFNDLKTKITADPTLALFEINKNASFHHWICSNYGCFTCRSFSFNAKLC